MDNLGVSKSIYYFHSEGRQNLKKTAELVIERARELDIKYIIVFTANGEGAFILKDYLGEDSSISILAATFPYKQEFTKKNDDGSKITVISDISKQEVKKQLSEKGITLIQGALPFQDIIIPGTTDIKIQTLNYTLSLISGGLKLCIQAILMANDSGHIESGQQVIAMSADTAIVARSCLSTLLFHPSRGLEVSEIICKPNQFSITHTEKI